MEFSSQHEAAEHIAQGIARGRYKDCAHLRLLGPAAYTRDTFAPFCEMQAFVSEERAISYSPRCPVNCRLFEANKVNIEKGYDAALVCLNGHLINEMAITAPDHNTKFCDKCGAATIIECPECGEKIRGYYHSPGVFGGGMKKPPNHCHNCGAAYPWTVTNIAAAQELIAMSEELSAEEKEDFGRAVEEVTRDTAKAKPAEQKIKRYSKKIAGELWGGIKAILTEITTEAIKKSMGL